MNATTAKLFPWSSLFASIAFLISASMTAYVAYAQETPSSANHDLQARDAQDNRSWQVGGFFAGGFAPFYEERPSGAHWRETMELFNAGFVAGKMLTALHGPGFLHGRREAALEVIPFWLAYYPKQEFIVYPPDNSNVEPSKEGLLGFSTHGVSVTPLLFRWNFQKRESGRFLPWAQLGSGLLWTSKEFPQPTFTKGGNTSRINFTPQVDFGESIFTKKNQSLDLALKVVHISSAGLGEYNPGVNVTLQFSLGYSWWK